MAQVCFQMIVFQSDGFLEPVLETLAQFAPIIVTEGPVAYYQAKGFKTSTDHTNEILAKYVPTSNIVHGVFEEKDEMMNRAIHLIPNNTSHVWMVDADECYKPEAIENTLKLLDEYDSVSFTPLTFFGGFNHTLTGFEQRFDWIRIQRWHEGARWHTHRPPRVLAPDLMPYRMKRHLASSENFYHYSYVFPKQVKSKIAYYTSRNPRGVIPNYFNKAYLNWVLGDDNTKAQIEYLYDGVHEWQPSARGDCRTVKFTGTHPEVIAKRLPEYYMRFTEELREVTR